MCVHKHDDIFICISYTNSLIAISISKTKTGIDIEYIRTIHLRNFAEILRNTEAKRDMLQKDNVDTLKNWTLREAYCKLTDQSMLACLNKEIDFNDIYHQELVINNRYVLSVAFASKNNKINICHFQKSIIT
ncbi:4'-phosphopantetheinyl transferase superfamily protein [Methanococcoides orientis]|uniref:4'-phosphopantetheinyl transferase superfamily protein n=1 Tax=Methanococcoides orientis TaxID=2822137 RepID=UPI0035C085C5|nr:4'-phosphopantetheinyl transferase superfamily protein [Methanococcoides orientis]